MPVGLGEVGANHEILLSESIEHMIGHITVFTVFIRALCNAVIRIFGIEHTESVVMFGSKYQIFESGVFHDGRPFCRIELGRIKRVCQSPIPFLEVTVGGSRKYFLSAGGKFIFRT